MLHLSDWLFIPYSSHAHTLNVPDFCLAKESEILKFPEGLSSCWRNLEANEDGTKQEHVRYKYHDRI